MRLTLLKTSLLSLAVALFVLGTVSPANAATLTVTTGADEYDGVCDSHCSLRDALAAAASGDTITFAGDTTIYLNSTLSIAKNLTIDGGAYTVTISGDSGNDGSRNVRAFTIAAGNVAALKNLIITNSYNNDRGAAIYNAGTLTVSGCRFTNNEAANFGGAIYTNQGSLTVQNCTFSNNTSTYGGAIAPFRSNINIESSTFSGNSASNQGGAIYGYQNTNDAYTMTITRSLLTNNNSWHGGGIYMSNMVLAVQASEFANNTARYGGGAIYFDSSSTYYKILTVDNSSFVENIGGTVRDAYVRGGGAINNLRGAMTIRNSTFSGNASPQYEGGAIENWGPLTLINSTLIGNSSHSSSETSGVANWSDLTLRNTIIAGSFPGPDCQSSGAVSLSSLNSLVEDGTCSAGGVNLLTGDPLTGLLADYGGPRIGADSAAPLHTHALLPGSPALDAGDPATCLAADQRDITRPQGAICDIGAYESRGFSLTYSAGSGQSTPITTTFANPLSVRLAETGGSGLPGAVVTFSAPASGPSLTAASLTATTGTNGIAALPATANAVIGGPYTITASAANLAGSIDFALINSPLPTVALSVSAASGAEAEQTAITVTAAASAAVTGDQTVDITVTGAGITAGDYSLSSTTLTIPSGQSSASVTFTVQDDAFAEGAETATLTLANLSSAIEVGSPVAQDITISDNDSAGYFFSANDFSLVKGAARVITVVLNSQPFDAVTISLSSSDSAQCTVSPDAITLDGGNWQSGADFSVTAVNNDLSDEDQPCSIITTVSSADLVYNSLDPDDLYLTIISQRRIYLPFVIKMQP